MTTTDTRGHRPGFAVNTLWTWTSVAVNVVMAFFLSPLLIRRLGDEAYGLWTLVFSVAEYYTLLDFGFRSAIVKYVAQHWTLGEDEELTRTLNTAFLFLALMGMGLLAATFVLAPLSPHFFVISPEMQETFVYIGLVTGAGWAASLVFMCFSSCLEAIQRFDVSNRILIASNVVRVSAVLGMLLLGYGLATVVTVAVAARIVQCVLLWRAFARHFPQVRWSARAIDRRVFGRLARFSANTVPSTIGWLLLAQGPAIVVGHFLPARFVGFYALPGRLIQSVLDFVHRLGNVTTAHAAELVARREREALVRLAVQCNRYALVIFLPAAVFLLVYGDALFHVWLTPQYSAMSAPLLPVFVIATVAADASQFCSSSMLYSMAKHRVYSWALLVESVISAALIAHFAARGDLFAAAVASSLVMVVNRGGLTPFLLCRYLDYPVGRYIAEIAIRPLTLAAGVGGVLYVCRLTWLPGRTLPELIFAGALGSALFLLSAGRYCLLGEHQLRVIDVLGRKAPRLASPARRWFGLPQLEVTPPHTL
jgi:O-antigen/teichoic acid export membrane protein